MMKWRRMMTWLPILKENYLIIINIIKNYFIIINIIIIIIIILPFDEMKGEWWPGCTLLLHSAHRFNHKFVQFSPFCQVFNFSRSSSRWWASFTMMILCKLCRKTSFEADGNFCWKFFRCPNGTLFLWGRGGGHPFIWFSFSLNTPEMAGRFWIIK